MKNKIEEHFNHIKNVLNKENSLLLLQVKKIAQILEDKILAKKKIFVYGNGGSFADCSHFVGELTATYNSKKRRALPFVLLGSNLAAITAWANDFKFENYIEREFSAIAESKDLLFLLSTSGGDLKKKQSINLIKLAKYAKKNRTMIVSLLGKGGGELKKISDYCIVIDSYSTGTIQEMHKIILHSVCNYLEDIKK